MEFLTYLYEKNINFSVAEGKKISVYDDLDLSHTLITELPDNLTINGSLDLSHTKITKLPDNLYVKHNLDLRETQITKLPENLSLKGDLYLDAEKITNIAYHKECDWFGYPIIAVYVNGKILVATDYTFKDIDWFDCMVDDTLDNGEIDLAEANKYKQAARECIKKLEQMRNPLQ